MKSADDWIIAQTLVRLGASLVANSTIRCGTTIGQRAIVGSGSVATRDLPDYALVWGNPARLRRFVGPCGDTLGKLTERGEFILTQCPNCARTIEILAQEWDVIND